jgi:hypothetical protein
VSTRVDIEELETTKTEKLLAAVLAIFLLTGGVWTYQEIDDRVREGDPSTLDGAADPAIARRDRAQERVFGAEQRAVAARETLELRREAYRTALDAGREAPGLERAYEAAQSADREAQRELASARRALQAAQPAAAAAEQRLSANFEERRKREDRNIFLWRLAFVLGAIAIAYLLLWHLHGRESRYLALAFAAVVSSSLLALVLAGDYVTDYWDPLELGPLVLAIAGSALTIAAFYLLQRYLVGRLPARRVRKDQCPYCGYPGRGHAHCEGCGRELLASCSRCSAPRRVGTLHCRACGAT